MVTLLIVTNVLVALAIITLSAILFALVTIVREEARAWGSLIERATLTARKARGENDGDDSRALDA